jgi:hypothetical protein
MKITERHPVIQAIENSKLEDSDKLLAISEILNLEENQPEHGIITNADQIASMFTWTDSEIGYEFWEKVDYTISNGR